MLRSLHRVAIRILRRRPQNWSPRSFSLYLLRRQAEAGLLRDGGMTATQVCWYVRELRREVEQEVTARRHKHGR
jgi:hypothetical protein